MDFSILSKEELQNLNRMNQNLLRFAYIDMVQSGFDPRAVANWLRISWAFRSGNLYAPECSYDLLIASSFTNLNHGSPHPCS